ncbi:hypothetical protein LQZ19_02860 [Treponema primitia]|uniref:hypothetical protein n=1 Tax=Treponema primitia TaxID=88058 RepID=UPI00397E97AA
MSNLVIYKKVPRKPIICGRKAQFQKRKGYRRANLNDKNVDFSQIFFVKFDNPIKYTDPDGRIDWPFGNTFDPLSDIKEVLSNFDTGLQLADLAKNAQTDTGAQEILKGIVADASIEAGIKTADALSEVAGDMSLVTGGTGAAVSTVAGAAGVGLRGAKAARHPTNENVTDAVNAGEKLVVSTGLGYGGSMAQKILGKAGIAISDKFVKIADYAGSLVDKILKTFFSDEN